MCLPWYFFFAVGGTAIKKLRINYGCSINPAASGHICPAAWRNVAAASAGVDLRIVLLAENRRTTSLGAEPMLGNLRNGRKECEAQMEGEKVGNGNDKI